MRMPWSNKVGLAKAAAILTTILLLSLGLCGINFVAMDRVEAIGVSDAHHGMATSLSTLFLVLGFVESGIIILSGIALAFVLLVLLIQMIWKKISKRPNSE